MDQELVNKFIFEQMLIGKKVRFAFAPSEAEAIMRIRSHQPALVLIDHSARQIQSLRLASRIGTARPAFLKRLVVLVDEPIADPVRSALAHVFDEIVPKPLKLSALDRLVGNLC